MSKIPDSLVVLNQTKAAAIAKIKDYMASSQIVLPQNYSYGNALNQLQLMIQDNEDLLSCSPSSIAKVMLDMVVLGLNPAKEQCYVIPYKGQASLQTSYLGKITLAKRIDATISDIVGRVVKKGEVFEYEDLPNGYSKIIKHQTTLESMDSPEILAAYATILYNDGKEPKSLIMTFNRIKKSWSKSKMKPLDDRGNIIKGKTHDVFTEEMALRTVKAAICKPIIDTSDDSSLFAQTVQRLDLENADFSAKDTIQENLCTDDVIDISDFEEAEQPVENLVENVDNIDNMDNIEVPVQDTLFQ